MNSAWLSLTSFFLIFFSVSCRPLTFCLSVIFLLSLRSPAKRLERKSALWRRRKRGECFEIGIYGLPGSVDVHREEKQEWSWLCVGGGKEHHGILLIFFVSFRVVSICHYYIQGRPSSPPPPACEIKRARRRRSVYRTRCWWYWFPSGPIA